MKHDAPDAELANALRINPALLAQEQAAAHAAWQSARALPWAPSWRMDRAWAEAQASTGAALRAAGHGTHGPMHEASQVARLRVALRVRDEMEAVARMTETDRQAAWQQDRDDATRALHQGQLPSALPARPRITPAEQIAALARRGISLAPREGDTLHATPAALLDDADRTMIRDRKPELLAALAASIETF